MLSRSVRSLGYIMCHVILEASIVESGFLKTPLNTVAVVGQYVKMTCWTNADTTTQWFFKHHGQSASSLVYNGGAVSPNFTPRFSVHKSNGKYDLTTKNVMLTDAGIYECVELSKDDQGFSTPVSATAELIVLESDPLCNTNISTKDDSITEFDNVAFRCTVNFSGQFNPSLQWSVGESTLNETHLAIHSNVSHGMQHLSSVTILQVTAELNDIQITCKTRFIETSKKVHSTNATNTPNYLFLWNITLNVHFGARNVTVTPPKESYYKEDVLYCNAVGNPRPTYTWRNVRTNERIGVGPQLFLSKTQMHADQLYAIECVAENKVAGEVRLSSVKVDVKVSGTTELLYVTISIGILCFILLLVVFVIGREYMKGWIVDLTSLCRRQPTTEPDVLPSIDENQNELDAGNFDLDPNGHYAIPAEIANLGNATRQRDENEIGSHVVQAGAVGGYSEQNAESVPVYAAINKPNKYKKPGSNTTNPSQTIDSNHNRNEYVACASGFGVDNPAGASVKLPSSQLNIGMDGTVYAELKTDENLPHAEAMGSLYQNPVFNKSEYASIDHTNHPQVDPLSPPQKG